MGAHPRSLKRRSIHLAVFSALFTIGSVSHSSASAQTEAIAFNASPTETLVLRVFLNSVDKGDVFAQRSDLQGFFVKVDDLKSFGLREPSGSVTVLDGESYVAISSLKDVTYSYDAKTLVLSLVADPQVLGSSTISALGQRRQSTITPSGNSAFFNYALTSSEGSSASNSRLGFAGELGVKLGDYLLVTDAATVSSPVGSRFVRLMSSVTRDDRENLQRFVVGDFLTPSRDLGTSVNLGGISISKNYGLDPYFVRFPTQSVAGNVSLPSELEVYLDGQRIRTERLAPGSFQLQDIVAYGGSRNVQLLLRDAFGRVQQLNYSLYFSDQPLQNNFHEYNYNFGALRRQYGLQSNNYGPAAFTMFHRYGFSNSLTMGWRADVTKDLVNTGPTLTAVLGNYGVVNLALAGSTFSDAKGYAAQGSYTYDSKSWAVSFFARRDSSRYASLGDPITFTNRKYEANLSATYRLPQNASISASRSLFTSQQPATTLTTQALLPSFLLLGNRSVTSLAYATPLDGIRAQFAVTVSRIKENALPARNELFVGLNFSLDQNYYAATSYRADRNGHSESARFTKGLPIGEGLGYDLSVDQSSANGSNQQVRANIQYNAPAAAFRFERGQYLDQGQKFSDQRASVAGSLVVAGGEFGFSRPITSSYAIVKIGNVGDVPVLVNGQRAGLTNSRGIIVLPNLNANYENNVSIDSDALPLNLSLTTALKKVTPAPRSGTFVDFAPKKIQAFSGKLVAPSAGAVQAVELFEIDILVDSVSQKLVTGRGGEFYVENIPAGTYKATATDGMMFCNFSITFPASDEFFIDLGTVACVLQAVRK